MQFTDRPFRQTRITKRSNKYQNDSSDEEDGPSMPKLPDLTSLLKGDKKKVFRDHNHIYFRCEVTIERVNKLCNLIEEYNRDQDMLRADITTAIIVPKPIYLHITSLGGDLMAGFLAYDYIKNSKIPVYTIAEGYTVSSGANMFMGGHKRFMTENSYVLIHQLNQTACGHYTFHDMIDNTANIVEFMSKMYAIYLNNIRHHRSNVPSDDILTKEKLENHVLHDIYWNYETCLRYGIVDALYTNYVDTDMTDVQSIIQSETGVLTVVPPKIYTLKELVPSKKIINKIKETAKNDSKNDVMDLIKTAITKQLTTDPVNGLINVNSTDKKTKVESKRGSKRKANTVLNERCSKNKRSL